MRPVPLESSVLLLSGALDRVQIAAGTASRELIVFDHTIHSRERRSAALTPASLSRIDRQSVRGRPIQSRSLSLGSYDLSTCRRANGKRSQVQNGIVGSNIGITC